eukprot:CAMPEP_0180288470 /NCGR_PEP_ID=MMETSP0988-20121125/14086_1 /TAXON_ID=697907 /ORGANISM="non described non described, Strain CCMP2293" /LENGTH=75 /DNA_ID=CAMNT_0022263191 /DNA_START=269 /DNA_END=493 /DNA_ORIENTATION=+
MRRTRSIDDSPAHEPTVVEHKEVGRHVVHLVPVERELFQLLVARADVPRGEAVGPHPAPPRSAVRARNAGARESR